MSRHRRHPALGGHRWRHYAVALLALVLSSLWLGTAAAAELVPLADDELARVHGEGMSVYLNLQLDALTEQQALGQNAVNTGGATTSWSDALGTAGFPATGSQSLALTDASTNFAISGNALQYSNSFLTVLAQGDVGIGVNVLVIMDANQSTFNVSSNNFNFAQFWPGQLP